MDDGLRLYRSLRAFCVFGRGPGYDRMLDNVALSGEREFAFQRLLPFAERGDSRQAAFKE